jgi:uncharacterized repeat protein (TIGR04138 family)
MSSTSSFPEKIEVLIEQDATYAPEAYYFLRDALENALKARKKKRRDPSPHVSAAELLDAFRLHALREFGPMAQTVFGYWGIATCEDVGRMVFNLVEVGVFGKTEQDTLDAFRQGYDFDEAFETPFLPPSLLAKKS